MAIKVGLENNILKIDNGTYIEYFNSAWCNMDFAPLVSPTQVTITDEGKTNNGKSITILFSEFQDLSGTPINTEETIATYLSDKIG